MNPSLWLAGREPIAGDPTFGLDNEFFDAVVVGAGMTGLTTAVALSRAGHRTLVVEPRYLGAGTTGNATGQVTVLHGNRLGRIVRRHGRATAASFLKANLEAIDWLARFCEESGVELQRRRAVSFSQTGQGLDGLEDDFRALGDAGLAPQRLGPGDVDLPFCFAGGIALPDQYQFDPMDFLAAAVDEVRRLEGMVVTGTRLLGVASGPVASLVLEPTQEPRSPGMPKTRTVLARRVVVAAKTAAPGGTAWPALATAGRTGRAHAAAFHATDPAAASYPKDMLVSVDGPSRSLRTAMPGDGIERLIVGGGNVRRGRDRDAGRICAEIEDWTNRAFPGMVRTHAWSAEEYNPVRGFPVAGPVPNPSRRTETVLVATGYAKWGMTNSVAAALKVVRATEDGAKDNGDGPLGAAAPACTGDVSDTSVHDAARLPCAERGSLGIA
ncbi:NAD(P)/FAD-dependent oxidoreductase [Arthrobacter sp. KK5.5]|uniref:NAD(P)/FAD-dependent oxidoreductase n=1 Tax=Arthrobacter sp. KK5.5 TaxID=3373084 RepID=UPI003EE71C25